jgi:hypothetical protein
VAAALNLLLRSGSWVGSPGAHVPFSVTWEEAEFLHESPCGLSLKYSSPVGTLQFLKRAPSALGWSEARALYCKKLYSRMFLSPGPSWCWPQPQSFSSKASSSLFQLPHFSFWSPQASNGFQGRGQPPELILVAIVSAAQTPAFSELCGLPSHALSQAISEPLCTSITQTPNHVATHSAP